MNKIQLNKDIQLLELGNNYQIAGLLFSGNNRSFVTTLPHKHNDINEPIDHLELDEEGMNGLMKQLDTLEVEILKQGDAGLFKAIVRKSQRQIDTAIQWMVFDRDNYTCRYCGRKGIPLSVDHVILWEVGGAAILDNLITACKSCNRDRGSMEYEAWLNSPMYTQKSKDLPESILNANKTVALDLPRLETLKTQVMRTR